MYDADDFLLLIFDDDLFFEVKNVSTMEPEPSREDCGRLCCQGDCKGAKCKLGRCVCPTCGKFLCDE